MLWKSFHKDGPNRFGKKGAAALRQSPSFLLTYSPDFFFVFAIAIVNKDIAASTAQKLIFEWSPVGGLSFLEEGLFIEVPEGFSPGLFVEVSAGFSALVSAFVTEISFKRPGLYSTSRKTIPFIL